MVCPACLNNDEYYFKRIKGTFLLVHEYEYHSDDIDEISLYVCKKCSNVMIDHSSCYQKEDLNKKEED